MSSSMSITFSLYGCTQRKKMSTSLIDPFMTCSLISCWRVERVMLTLKRNFVSLKKSPKKD